MATLATLCRHCMKRQGMHRAGDLACPADGPAPKWPSHIKDEREAGRCFDARLAKFWAARKTHFAPR